MEVSGQLHAPGCLTPREKVPGTHWIGGWAGPRAVLDAVVKRKIPSPCQESNCEEFNIKVKVKLSLCLTKYHAIKTYWGNGGIAPCILDLSTRWR
jgi:hypothetical protein